MNPFHSHKFHFIHERDDEEELKRVEQVQREIE